MKEIINQYGAIIIASIILLFIFSVVINLNHNGKRGLLAISGEMMENDTKNIMKERCVAYSYNQYKNLRTPKLLLSRKKQIYVNEKIKVSDYLHIRDGVEGSYKIYMIKDENDNIIQESSVLEEDDITFSQPGIYTLFLAVYNANDRMTYSKIKIPVNRR